MFTIKSFIDCQNAGEDHEPQATKLPEQYQPNDYFLAYRGRLIDGWISIWRHTIHYRPGCLVVVATMYAD